MGARHYDSLIGRFISPDPLGHSATPDLYSYALGDPINFFDPTGRIGTGIYKQQNSSFKTETHWLEQVAGHGEIVRYIVFSTTGDILLSIPTFGTESPGFS